jgi:hypothetical protein
MLNSTPTASTAAKPRRLEGQYDRSSALVADLVTKQLLVKATSTANLGSGRDGW